MINTRAETNTNAGNKKNYFGVLLACEGIRYKAIGGEGVKAFLRDRRNVYGASVECEVYHVRTNRRVYQGSLQKCLNEAIADTRIGKRVLPDGTVIRF